MLCPTMCVIIHQFTKNSFDQDKKPLNLFRQSLVNGGVAVTASTTAFLLVLLPGLSTWRAMCIGADASTAIVSLSTHSAHTHIHSICAVRHLTDERLGRRVIVRFVDQLRDAHRCAGGVHTNRTSTYVPLCATCVASLVFFRTGLTLIAGTPTLPQFLKFERFTSFAFSCNQNWATLRVCTNLVYRITCY